MSIVTCAPYCGTTVMKLRKRRLARQNKESPYKSHGKTTQDARPIRSLLLDVLKCFHRPSFPLPSRPIFGVFVPSFQLVYNSYALKSRKRPTKNKRDQHSPRLAAIARRRRLQGFMHLCAGVHYGVGHLSGMTEPSFGTVSTRRRRRSPLHHQRQGREGTYPYRQALRRRRAQPSCPHRRHRRHRPWSCLPS